MTSKELRSKFLEFFEQRGHKVIPSASLLPENDPTSLFTSAGMQQFKRYYQDPSLAPAARIATVQKCLRTGDIDEVGDESHLTFFEMLGNFSFGYPKVKNSYFKKEAINWAWEFLTKELKISKDRVSATYFKGENDISIDKESFEILKEVTGFAGNKIKGRGKDETFWSLGSEGSPGGPTVEFYVDGIEIWNLVFNEYIMRNGEYTSSEFKGVDTGMGLERLSAVVCNESDVFQTDIFSTIISNIEANSNNKYKSNKEAFRVIADHLRSAIFLIAEGLTPSNKDQGYVLRRLIRRTVVKAKQLGIDNNLSKNLTPSIIDAYSGIYQFNQDQISAEIEKEEGKFLDRLESGMKLIESQKEFNGKILFDLYQTYGIPIEISIEEAERLGRQIGVDDKEEFYQLLKEHQEKSRTASAGMFKGGLADNKIETIRLHTAAHLLLAALRQVLSSEVNQKGSNITEERLRFDFNWPQKLSLEQISEVEKIVNKKIKENIPIEMEELSTKEAKKTGATGVFDDRYGEKVKIYTIGSFSKEICGGPHVKSTGELGAFKIIKEQSSSAGVRRIKAVLK